MKGKISILPIITVVVLIIGLYGCDLENAVNSPSATNTSLSMDKTKSSGESTIVCYECTHTPGYWKTHSEYGPAPADPAWYRIPGGLGPNTPLFETGLTWYQAFWTPPRGNAYYILAHQLMAARLNKWAGVSLSPSIVETAYEYAKHLLTRYDGNPYPMSAITGEVRREFIETAEILDQYNNGLIGPGHCPD
ncbi:MAG: hypothetical protein HY800_09760 [Ignavibacteriales bacterium]|nr:hypothetical protein [Ignavibacteriales bacterium]